MKYKIIVAFDKNKGIGYNNVLPWDIPSDMQKFVKLTKGTGKNAIIMGKNTWLSLPRKPLSNRDNLILSTTLENTNSKNIKIFKNIEDLNNFCHNKYEEIWIIGGSKIYSEFLKRNLVKEIYITYIDKEFLCDVFFPSINLKEWDLIENNYVKDDLYSIYHKKYIKL